MAPITHGRQSTPHGRSALAGVVSGALLKSLRIQLVVTGGDRFGPPGVGVPVVSNQVSWLDMVAFGAVQPLRMVAKSGATAPAAASAGTSAGAGRGCTCAARGVAARTCATAGAVYAGVSMTYLDHAATTPMLPEAAAAMSQALSTLGNASSLHGSGRRARRTVEESRESIADALGARPSEVVFTGGGTEGDNLTVKGLFWQQRAADPRRNRVLASAVEHHAVLDAVSWLADHEGAEVVWLPVDADGRVHPETLRAVLACDPGSVALVSVMWANNEVGTVAPVHELAEVAAEYGVPLHTDAVQAVGQLPVHFGRSGTAAMTLTGHKLGGPYGAGVLLLGREVTATPLLHGGGQERDVRSGTLDVPAIVGLATAIGHAVAAQPRSAIRLGALRDELVDGIVAKVPDAVLNGDSGDGVIDGGPSRLPGNAHLTFPGCEGDSLLMLLDARGIECSTGAACTAGVAQPSHVLLAMGASPAAARGSLRFSLGHTSTAQDVADVLDAIEPVVTRARGAGIRRARAS